MFSFVRRRMYTSALPLIIVLLGVFLLARLTGDPTSLYLPESATQEQREAFAAKNGFDQPLLTQMIDYFKGVIHLDFGTSMRTGESASEMALRAFPATLQLAITTMLLAIVGAIVIGCWAAYRPNSIADRLSSLLSMTAASIPDFWFAITGVWLFAVLLGVLPTSGVDSGLSWILPIATLMIRPLGVLTQVVRGAMVSALSAAPALTVAGDLAVGLINGAVVVEAIFGWPGIGKLMIDAILQRDFAVLQAAVLLTAVAIFALNIIIDGCYALLDARVREPARV
jgi:peptide/nickel transport system permease protein